jgi:TolA-binding protein
VSRVVGLHPEALLDRETSGKLTEAERARLDAHLEACAACRLERQLRADFADELAAEETPSERLALTGLSSTPPPLEVETTAPLATREVIFQLPRRSPRRVTRATWLLVAAAVFAVSAAGATGLGQRAWSRLVGAPAPAGVPTDVASAHVVAKHTAPRRVASAAPPMVPSEPARELPSADVLTPPPPAALPVLHRAAAVVDGASALFEEATAARRQGSYGRAIDLQRELLSHYPRSREAHVARETMGRLLLDRGDPAGAVSSFDAYLADGSGELGEEAMFGRATALERLGRPAQAADAWRALIAAYPETPYASHAKSRLGSLSVR